MSLQEIKCAEHADVFSCFWKVFSEAVSVKFSMWKKNESVDAVFLPFLHASSLLRPLISCISSACCSHVLLAVGLSLFLRAVLNLPLPCRSLPWSIERRGLRPKEARAEQTWRGLPLPGRSRTRSPLSLTLVPQECKPSFAKNVPAMASPFKLSLAWHGWLSQNLTKDGILPDSYILYIYIVI